MVVLAGVHPRLHIHTARLHRLQATISLRPLFVEALAPWEGAALPMPPCVVWRDPEQAGGGLR